MAQVAAPPAKPPTAVATAEAPGEAPKRAGLVLASLILGAAVANMPLAMANVALPSIGAAFDASQTQLNLVAVGYSLGLACSVLWLGALGDRYGRKLMLLLGVTLSVPAALAAAFAPTIQVLIGARIFGGLAAGMAYPTTLALIAALWTGPGRTRSIALWAAIGGAISALGPLLSGLLLEHYSWPSVFLAVMPLALLAFIMAILFVPAHVHETKESVDNLGGILSVVLVGTFIMAINFAPVPGARKLVLGLSAVAAIALVLFVLRQRRAGQPALRPGDREPPDLLGRCGRGHHRVRLADGLDVHRPAVPARRARVLDAERRLGDPAGGVLHDLGGPSVRQAGRVARRPVHPAGRIRLRLPRLRHDASLVEGRHPLLDRRDWDTPSWESESASQVLPHPTP